MSKMPHSTFMLKNFNQLTTGFGFLTPFLFERVVPGDKVKRCRSEIAIQMMPMAAPVYQSCKAFVHYYYVPDRILKINEEYSAFVSRESRTLATLPQVPSFKSYTTVGDLIQAANSVFTNSNSGAVIPTDYSAKVFVNSLLDYLRVQFDLKVADLHTDSGVVILDPLFAYYKVYLDHYVSTKVGAVVPHGTDAQGNMLTTTYSYDQLTYIFSHIQKYGFSNYIKYNSGADILNTTSGAVNNRSLLAFLLGVGYVMFGRSGDMFQNLWDSSYTGANSEALGDTVESARIADAIQRYKERKARVGHGVGEFLWEFFKVKSSDARLRRSQFLGGGRKAIQIEDVLQTSQDTDTSALGELAGNGFASGKFGFGRRYFEEYGYLFGFIYILPKQAYFQGVDQLWHRKTMDDEYLEAFDSIGDEAVYNSEICYRSSADLGNALGYQARYDRYKYMKDEVHGDFLTSLKYWHANREFNQAPSLPNLRSSFGKSINRIFNETALANTHAPRPIMVFVKNKLVWRRKMRYRSFPKLS